MFRCRDSGHRKDNTAPPSQLSYKIPYSHPACGTNGGGRGGREAVATKWSLDFIESLKAWRRSRSRPRSRWWNWNLRVFLTGKIVLVVVCYVKSVIKTCSTKLRRFRDIPWCRVVELIRQSTSILKTVTSQLKKKTVGWIRFLNIKPRGTYDKINDDTSFRFREVFWH